MCGSTTPNNSGGWIKLFYRFADWEWFDDKDMVYLFINLLLAASYRPFKWHGTDYPRGTLITSIDTLATRVQLSPKQLRTRLKRLAATGEISVKTTNKNHVITICNFDLYQATDTFAGQTEGKQRANKGQTEDKQKANKGQTEDKQKANKGQTHIYKESKKEIIYNYLVVDNIAREDFFQDFFSEPRRATIEQLCLSIGIDRSDMERLARDALNEWEAVGLPPHEDMHQARQHLISHIRKKIDAQRRAQSLKSQQPQNTQYGTHPQDRHSRFRSADPATLRPEDYTGTI